MGLMKTLPASHNVEQEELFSQKFNIASNVYKVRNGCSPVKGDCLIVNDGSLSMQGFTLSCAGRSLVEEVSRSTGVSPTRSATSNILVLALFLSAFNAIGHSFKGQQPQAV